MISLVNDVYLHKRESIMITTDFYSETPVLKGKDAERFVENMVNAKPLSKKRIAEIFADAEKFESRQFKKRK